MDKSFAIETAALGALHGVAGDDLRRSLGLGWHRAGGMAISIAAALPDSAIVVNRALGLRSAGDLDLAAGSYREAGVGRFFLSPQPDAAPLLRDAAAAAGLAPARGWRKFVLDLGPASPPPAPAPGVRIARIGAELGAAFAAIVCDAFDLGPAARPWLARLPLAAGWHVFLAQDGDTPVGAGAVFLDGADAWTDWGATLPAARGRGVQLALLGHRVAFARAAGCARVHTCTGEAVPGDPQHSWNNILRTGFRPAVLRPNFAPRRGTARAAA